MMNLPVTPTRLHTIDVLRNQPPDGPVCVIRRPSPQNGGPEYLYDSKTWTRERRLALSFGAGQARRLIADHAAFFGVWCELVDLDGNLLQGT